MISEQYKEGPDSDGSLELELGKFAKRKKLEQKSEQHGISATSELQTHHQGRSPRNERVYDIGHHLGSAPHHTSTGGRLGTGKKTREGFTENENRNYLSI